MKITDLEPQAIWKNFSLLNHISRPSKKEAAATRFVRDFGVSLGLETTVDEVGNVLIRKPATRGMEDKKTIILQAHLDMVCQKNNDVDFDFAKDAIQTYIDGDWVKAKGTTLGADNGIGVATIMAILQNNEMPHPAIEALFTIDEETGMSGAAGLKPGFLRGEILLNLDTEEDDEIDIGCAGGVDVTATKKYTSEPVADDGFLIEIGGLQGGHSGVDIHRGRGNANVILRRFLFAGIDDEIRLVEIDGGGLRNAIPREAKAIIQVGRKSDFISTAEILKQDILREFETVEKNLVIRIEPAETGGKALSVADSKTFIMALVAAHNGVYRMSPEVEGLVEASNNVARIVLKDGEAGVQCLTRSSVESTKSEVAFQLKSSFELGGIDVKFSGSYPGWKPDPDAAIIGILNKIYTEKFGKTPRVVACHAGLECGIIGAGYPDMEMVSFGPTIIGAHSPDERVSISSVQKFWTFLQEILKSIPETTNGR